MSSFDYSTITKDQMLDWAKSLKRTTTKPLDPSSILNSYEDACNYAKGDGSDTRGLGKTAYIGQIIVVHGENEKGVEGVYSYLLAPSETEGTLAELLPVGSDKGSLVVENLTKGEDNKIVEATEDNIGQIIIVTKGDSSNEAGPYIVIGEGSVYYLAGRPAITRGGEDNNQILIKLDNGKSSEPFTVPFASVANIAGKAEEAGSAETAAQAIHADDADTATTAGFALEAGNAENAVNAENAENAVNASFAKTASMLDWTQVTARAVLNLQWIDSETSESLVPGSPTICTILDKHHLASSVVRLNPLEPVSQNAKLGVTFGITSEADNDPINFTSFAIKSDGYAIPMRLVTVEDNISVFVSDDIIKADTALNNLEAIITL